MKKRARPSFSPDFKLEAVRLVVEGRRPLSQVARELDLRPEQLRGWKQQLQARGDVARPVSTLSLEEENRRLKRELEVARMERDFAKKQRRSSRKTCAAVRDDRPAPRRVSAAPDVSGPGRDPVRLLRVAAPRPQRPLPRRYPAGSPDRRLPPPESAPLRQSSDLEGSARGSGPPGQPEAGRPGDARGRVGGDAPAALPGHHPGRSAAGARPQPAGPPVYGVAAQPGLGGRRHVPRDGGGAISPWSSISARGRWWVGRSVPAWIGSSPSPPWAARWPGVARRGGCCITRIGGRSTPAATTKPSWLRRASPAA